MPHLIQIPEIGKITRQSAALLRVLANEKRLLILCKLRAGETTVGELQKYVGMSQSALSQHLSYLRRAGLVSTRRSRQTILYSVSDHPAQKLLEILCEMHGKQ